MNAKILIIDDDEKLCSLLQDYLKLNHFDISISNHPDKGLDLLSRINPDMIILDVMLPGKDGFEVCRIIRKERRTPILMLTARGDVMDRVVGLELGADDYLPKPFEPRELLARIQSILRRSDSQITREKISYKNLELDLEKRTVVLDKKDLVLTSMEFNLLAMFAKKPGKTFSRDDILNHLQGTSADVFSRSIDISISRLRQKLGENKSETRFIKTVWGTGYVFVGEKTL